nr:hypothetical protein [Tanacetum cinerariifolium]
FRVDVPTTQSQPIESTQGMHRTTISLVNVNEEEDESTEDDYELRRREKGKEMDSNATNDDELPTEKVSQELMDEMSQTVDEAKLRKVVDEMLRQ